METLEQRVAAAIKYYRDEIQEWAEVPVLAIMTRERLPRLIELGAPLIIIENEIGILRMRVNQMKERRLGVVVQ